MSALESSPAFAEHGPPTARQAVSPFPDGDEPSQAGHEPASESPARRRELAAFLRARRARILPDEVGLVGGRRRRTPGLRREEVAQLAGVGVTWYTWIEQGRPIRASTDVLDAIARTLRLDATEREHMFRLADVSIAATDPASFCLDPEVQVILDHLEPFPASVINGRYDMLAWNRPYAALFPGLVHAAPSERNVLWQVFTTEPCAVLDRERELPRMVATLRGAFARHLSEPSWVAFIERLSAASPQFADLWARHEVAEPSNRMKRFRAVDGGEMVVYATSFSVSATPEARLIVYSPADTASAGYLERQRAGIAAVAIGAQPGA